MSTYTVPVKGNPVTFTAQAPEGQAITYLREMAGWNDFAAQLVSAYERRGWSYKQIAWANYLANQQIERNAAKAAQNAMPGKFENLVKEMFAAANGKLFRLRLPGNLRVDVIQYGNNAGCLYIKEHGVYLGKITKTGHAHLRTASDEVIDILEDANEPGNLVKLAQAYGHETGICSCCGRHLSDEKSVALGIGPICLKKYF